MGFRTKTFAMCQSSLATVRLAGQANWSATAPRIHIPGLAAPPGEACEAPLNRKVRFCFGSKGFEGEEEPQLTEALVGHRLDWRKIALVLLLGRESEAESL